MFLFNKSPVYWSTIGYDITMKILCGKEYWKTYADIAQLIPDKASVVDVCCGTCGLYINFLQKKSCRYIGLDVNSNFVKVARNHGIKAKVFNLYSDTVPPADYVVISSSFYHFHKREDEIFNKLLSASRCALIINEPIRNVSSSTFFIFRWLAAILSNPGVGEYRYRYNPQSFQSFAEKHNVSQFVYKAGRRFAIGIFKKNCRNIY